MLFRWNGVLRIQLHPISPLVASSGCIGPGQSMPFCSTSWFKFNQDDNNINVWIGTQKQNLKMNGPKLSFKLTHKFSSSIHLNWVWLIKTFLEWIWQSQVTNCIWHSSLNAKSFNEKIWAVTEKLSINLKMWLNVKKLFICRQPHFTPKQWWVKDPDFDQLLRAWY